MQAGYEMPLRVTVSSCWIGKEAGRIHPSSDKISLSKRKIDGLNPLGRRE